MRFRSGLPGSGASACLKHGDHSGSVDAGKRPRPGSHGAEHPLDSAWGDRHVSTHRRQEIAMRTPLQLTFAACILACHTQAAPLPQLQPYTIAAGLPDVVEPAPLDSVRVEGWLGQRIQANATNRLLTIELEPLLAGFRQKPGVHPWIGEHIGKSMNAATLAWVYTGDARLREKLDYAAAELVKAQEPDGYLGTYIPEKRFGLNPGSDWDVWSHKYNLIGLLTY
ncbi:hypothetical protein EG829_25405, partial [bacterium]|nr:hypothetical protein [bacterium]